MILRKTRRITKFDAKRITKFDGLGTRGCEDVKGTVSPEIGPKTFGTLEEQASGDR